MPREPDADAQRRLLSLTVADDAMDTGYNVREGERDARSGVNRIDSVASASARTLVSSLSFMFQRPIRLFRPVQCTSAC